MKSNTKFDTKRLVGMAMFAALAYAVTFVFRIPVMFLTFDAKDAIIIISSLIYGPLAGVFISLTVALLELITISGTGVYGFIMNFASKDKPNSMKDAMPFLLANMNIAKKKNINFTNSEIKLIAEILTKDLSSEEKAKVNRIMSMMLK